MADKTDKNWFAKHKILTVILVLVILGIIGSIAGSGSNSPSVTTTVSNASSKSSNSTSSSSSNSSSSTASTAKVGDTINIGGKQGIAVTLLQVIDPAQGADQYTTPDAGKRFVAVDVKIVNNGTSSYQDDANSNLSIVGTDNQTYTADFDDVGGCTNFNEGEYTLAAGQSATGCVVFQLPDAVNTSKVEFQTQNGLSSSTGEWTVQ